jgi:hypothetical protein
VNFLPTIFASANFQKALGQRLSALSQAPFLFSWADEPALTDVCNINRLAPLPFHKNSPGKRLYFEFATEPSTGRFWSIFSSGIGTSINLHRAMASQEEWFRPGILTVRAPGAGPDEFIEVCTSSIQGMHPKHRIR